MKSQKKRKNWFLKGIFASIVGFINGFFGGGGGLVCVPTLEKVYKLNTKQSHATAIAIMFPLSVASSIVYLCNNSFNFVYTLCISIGVIAGGLLGAYLLKKFNSSAIRWIFIVVLFTAGIRMIV